MAKVAVTNRPEACRIDVGNGGDLDSVLHIALESLEALVQFDRRFRYTLPVSNQQAFRT